MIVLTALKEIWTFLLVLLLGVPGIVVGYLARFVVNGVVIGYSMHAKFHKKSDETSP